MLVSHDERGHLGRCVQRNSERTPVVGPPDQAPGSRHAGTSSVTSIQLILSRAIMAPVAAFGRGWFDGLDVEAFCRTGFRVLRQFGHSRSSESRSPCLREAGPGEGQDECFFVPGEAVLTSLPEVSVDYFHASSLTVIADSERAKFRECLWCALAVRLQIALAVWNNNSQASPRLQDTQAFREKLRNVFIVVEVFH